MDWNTLAVTAAALVVAGLNAFTAWQAARTRRDVKTLEENTNSKMDAMLALTAKSSRAEGRKEEREIQAKG